MNPIEKKQYTINMGISTPDILEIARKINPPSRIAIVGDSSIVDNWLEKFNVWGIKDVTFITNGSTCSRASALTNFGMNGWFSMPCILSDHAGEETYYELSVENENGTLSPSTLKLIWPNIRTKSISQRQTTTLDAVYGKHKFPNWVFINQLAPLKILRGANGNISNIEVLAMKTVISDKLDKQYEVDFSTIASNVESLGLVYIGTIADLDPITGLAIFVRSYKPIANKLRKKNLEMAANIKSLQSKLETSNIKLNSLSEMPVNIEKMFRKELERMELTLKDSIDEEIVQSERLLNNAVKQIESFISINNHLAYGNPLLGFHGWPISPDIGLFLIKLLTRNKYDIVIEFGSGTSTAVIAATLTKQIGKTTRTMPVLHSFEHLDHYRIKTDELLSSLNTSGLAKVHLTPLAELKLLGSEYLYYDCETILDELSSYISSLGRRGKILLFIDGPPGSTCKNARFPAIPLIFSRFSNHNIDIVLDDQKRQDEKEIIDLWEKYWNDSNIDIIASTENSEKGTYFASYSPEEH